MNDSFYTKLRQKMDEYAHFVYHLTRSFPKEELYGITSQLRRSTLSIVLNYIEGYARRRDKTYRHFLDISYGSMQESKYLLEFSFQEHLLSKQDCDKALGLVNEIGAMLWTHIQKLDNSD